MWSLWKVLQRIVQRNALKTAKMIKGLEQSNIYHIMKYTIQEDRKIRVVFDCGACYAGTSTNQALLQARPYKQFSRSFMQISPRDRGVLLWCPIKYHQFYVNEEDRKLLRFLWWEGANLQARPLEYRMKVHALCAICTVPQVIPIVDRKWSREK